MTEYNENDTELVKDLRKQIAELSKTNKELTDKFGEVSKRDRERTLKDVFTEKGVKPGVVKFFPADVEATPESVDAWLSENAELFGIEVNKQENEGAETPPQVPDAITRLNALQSPSVSTGQAADLQHQITNASEADLLALIAQHGGGSVF